jgi:DNA invertase Pin-like site-specific DNA recombinase
MGTNEKRDALREGMRRWGEAQREQVEQRDPLVRALLEVGVSIEEIHQAMGLGRSTIDRIRKDQ